MGRPPLPVGTFGEIRFEVLGRHRVQAGASFRDFDGRRRYIVRSGQSWAQAERRLREALRDRSTASSPPVPADGRLSAMAALWLAEVDGSELASGTKRLYRFTVHAYVLPGLGELRLREGRPADRRPPRHSRPSLTQDVYLGRGTTSPRTAAVIRRAL